jgi:flagellar biosynthesis repressor protein FlbT
MGNIQITLKPGERIFINGAVLRVDRKVAIELLNDVTFLLENHVMQPEAATTPLRQLYFIVQMMLMDPANIESTKKVFGSTHALLMAHFTTPEILTGLEQVHNLISSNKAFDALKIIRALLPREGATLDSENTYQKQSKEKREVA